MSAHKVSLKKFIPISFEPAPAIFPIPESELAKIGVVVQHPPFHPKCVMAHDLEKLVVQLSDAECGRLLASMSAQPVRRN